MKQNTEEKSLQIIDNSLFGKIKCSIMKIFRIENKRQDTGILIMNANNTKGQFINSIKIEQDLDSTRILNLYNEYRAGKIKEEDLSKEDIEKVKKLYLKNIEKVKKSIEYYKYKIKILNTEV